MFLHFRPLLLLLVLLPGILLPMRQAAAANNGASPLVRSIAIVLPPQTAAQEHFEAIARDIIFIKPGQPFDPTQLEDSLSALRISRKFAKIHVDADTVNGAMALRFELTPFQFIRNLRIRGAYPLFQRDVLSAMTIYAGDVFWAPEIPAQQEAVAALYRREGYINPQVVIEHTTDAVHGNVDVLVRIVKGPYYTLNTLAIEGNHFFSENALKMRLASWRNRLLPGSFGRFTQTILDEDLQSMLSRYRQYDFAEAVITHNIIKHPETNQAELTITINEGPRYEVRFEGNNAFSNRRLTRELDPLQEGNPQDAHLRRIRQNLLALYAGRGFNTARIDYQTQPVDQNGQPWRRVIFKIEEGPQSIIQTVNITGNTALDQETLEKDLLTRPPALFHDGAFVPETLEEDLLALRTRYLQMGHTQVDIAEHIEFTEDRSNVSINLQIDEGVPTRVRWVEIRGLPHAHTDPDSDPDSDAADPDEAYRILELLPGAPYRSYMLQHDMNMLSTYVAEQGYPHVRVSHQVTLNQTHSAAEIVWEVEPGPFVRMGQFYFTGNFRTRQSLLQEALTLAPGEPFSMRRLLESQRNIRSLEIFNAVQFKSIGLKEQADTITLLVELEEKKPYYVTAGLGYETHKGVFANARIGDLNLWGRNKQTWLSGELSEVGYRSEAGLIDSKFLGTAFAANMNVYVEERQEFNQNFGIRSYGISGGFTRPLGPTVQAGFNLRLERRSRFETADSAWRLRRQSDEDLRATRTIVVGAPFVRYDSRDSYIRPRRGMLASLAVDLSKGIDNDLDDFFKYQLDWRYYVSPLPRLTLAGLLRAGLLDPYGASNQVPDDQLFFLGGTTNVRGFKENMLRFDPDGTPRGGRTSLSGSIEIRWEFLRNLEMAAFVDTGRLTRIADYSNDDGWRTSVGTGLRYITPIGPLGLLYGHNLNPGPGESSGRIHFSVGYTF